MSDDDIKPDDMARLINEAESSDKATHASEALTNAVSEAFIGVPSVARSERYATMTQVRQLMWQTRLDDAERLVAPHAASDLGFMLAWTELALWRATMHETPEHHAAVRHRIAVLDAHATAAFDRLHPDRATRSASTLGWLTGQTAADHPGVADVAPLERQLAFCDAALVLAFAPVARAALDVRAATAQSIATGAYYLRKAWKSFEVAQSAIDKVPAVETADPAQSAQLRRRRVPARRLDGARVAALVRRAHRLSRRPRHCRKLSSARRAAVACCIARRR
jgi:hypothetical protein